MAEQVSSLKTDVKYKYTPIGKIPVDWEVVQLKDISKKFFNGGTPDTTNRDYWDGNIPWVTGADFENQQISQIRHYITNEGVDNSATNIILKGRLLVVTRNGVGKLAIAPFDIAISRDITGIILDQEKTLTNYLYWYLNYSKNRLKALIQRTSINGLLRADLESFVVSLPPISEQKKITDILSTVDDVIHKTTQIIEKIKELKSGLIQRLLTRGIGHKKFKKTEIGQIPVDWGGLKLRDTVNKFYKEQKKIAEILSSTDDELEKESNHRDQLILLKKGLMQVLLTGKLRVAWPSNRDIKLVRQDIADIIPP